MKITFFIEYLRTDNKTECICAVTFLFSMVFDRVAKSFVIFCDSNSSKIISKIILMQILVSINSHNWIIESVRKGIGSVWEVFTIFNVNKIILIVE